MSQNDANGMANSVYPDLSVQKLRLITVELSKQSCNDVRLGEKYSWWISQMSDNWCFYLMQCVSWSGNKENEIKQNLLQFQTILTILL